MSAQQQVKTYNGFVESVYYSHPLCSQRLYDNFDQFFDNYVLCNGFSDWLESLRGCDLSEHMTIEMVKAFFVYGDLTAIDINNALIQVSEKYDVRFIGNIEGFTQYFWIHYLNGTNWEALRSDFLRKTLIAHKGMA